MSRGTAQIMPPGHLVYICACVHADVRETAEGDDVSVLRVDRCDVTDVGVYTCEAENRLGHAAANVIVTGLQTSSRDDNT